MIVLKYKSIKVVIKGERLELRVLEEPLQCSEKGGLGLCTVAL